MGYSLEYIYGIIIKKDMYDKLTTSKLFSKKYIHSLMDHDAYRCGRDDDIMVYFIGYSYHDIGIFLKDSDNRFNADDCDCEDVNCYENYDCDGNYDCDRPNCGGSNYDCGERCHDRHFIKLEREWISNSEIQKICDFLELKNASAARHWFAV